MSMYGGPEGENMTTFWKTQRRFTKHNMKHHLRKHDNVTERNTFSHPEILLCFDSQGHHTDKLGGVMIL